MINIFTSKNACALLRIDFLLNIFLAHEGFCVDIILIWRLSSLWLRIAIYNVITYGRTNTKLN
jgi:hypothetical protein